MKRIKITTKKNNITQAVIYCGGLGLRISKITKHTPKPLIRVNKLTVIEHIMKNFARFGINEILLLCGYKSNLFKEKYHNKILFGVKIRCVFEKSLLGTSGALLNAKKFLKNNFLISNGDTFFDININDLIFNFFKKKAILFLSIKKMKKKNRYDAFSINKKSQLNYVKNLSSFNINSGLGVMNKKIIEYLDKEGSLEKQIFPKLIKKKKIFGKIYFNNFIDMGVYEDLNKLPVFLEKMYLKPALFLDRDGVINKDIGYLYKKEDFIWKPKILELIKKFNDKNYYVFVITNQSGIGRGFYREKDLMNLNVWINKNVRAYGGNIDEFFFAPYYKFSKNKKYRKNYNLRKPNIGMIKLALRRWKIDLKKSLLIGDSQSDLQTARNANIKCRIIPFRKKFEF